MFPNMNRIVVSFDVQHVLPLPVCSYTIFQSRKGLLGCLPRSLLPPCVRSALRFCLFLVALVLPFLRSASRRAQEEAGRLARAMLPDAGTPRVVRRDRPAAWRAGPGDAGPGDAGAGAEVEAKGASESATSEPGDAPEGGASAYTSRLLAAKRRARQDRRRK